MNFTILTSQDLATGQVLDITKSGNHYELNFTDKNIFYRFTSYDLKEIKEKYLKVVDCFINGYYTFEQRIEIIKGDLNYER